MTNKMQVWPNISWWDRPMLQVTGRTTSVTDELLARASQDLVIKL